MSASEAGLPHSSLYGWKQIYLEETLEILLGKLSLSLFKVYAISFLLDYVTYPKFRDTILTFFFSCFYTFGKLVILYT